MAIHYDIELTHWLDQIFALQSLDDFQLCGRFFVCHIVRMRWRVKVHHTKTSKRGRLQVLLLRAKTLILMMKRIQPPIQSPMVRPCRGNGHLVHRRLLLTNHRLFQRCTYIWKNVITVNSWFKHTLRWNSYHAALIKIGPPTNEIGARTAPYEEIETFRKSFQITKKCVLNTIIAQWVTHANCFAPNPFSYGIDRATMPEPIINAIVANIETQPVRAKRFNKAGVRNTAAALTAVMPTDAPKYAYVSWMRSRTYWGQTLQ